MSIRFVLSMFAILMVSACGPDEPVTGTRGIGEYCDESSECEEGLECVPYQSLDVADGALICEDRALCSIPCASDEECTSALGEGHICEDSCATGACLMGSRG